MANKRRTDEECKRILASIALHGGNVSEAARADGVPRERYSSAWQDIKLRFPAEVAEILKPVSDDLAFEAVQLVRTHESLDAAAQARPDIPFHVLQKRYNIGVQRTGALGIEEPYLIRGTSTLFDGDGKAKLQWVKTKDDDKRRLAMMVAAIEKRCEQITPRPPIPFDEEQAPSEELCNLITLTDCHVAGTHGIDKDLVRKQLTKNEALTFLKPTKGKWQIPKREYDL